ncbi:MAG TPA: LysR family transcriptional regulator [Holophaga sp.]|nr:LysR family transcriptional regulator [Holophaga sp.]
MGNQLDLYQLRALHAFARVGSFAGAAQRLNLTQSAISHAIRKLEASAGVPLVTRHGSRVQLTEDGVHLCEACESVFSILDSVGEDLRSGRSRVSGRLRLGVPVEFGCSFLMKHIRPFLEQHPEIVIDFTLDDDLLDPLLRDDLDMAIDCHEHAYRELKQTPLFREVYVVVCSPEYRDRFRPASPAGLDACTILSCDKVGAWWHRFLSALPEEQRPRLDQLVAMNHIRAMVNAAVHGLGVALVPQYCVLEELETGRLVSLFPAIRPLEDRFCLYQKRAHADRGKQRLLTAFLQALKPEEFGAVRASAR